MSFLGRIAQQARSPFAPGHAVARPKGQVPSLPTMAPPVDRPTRTEPVVSQTEPSLAAPNAVPPSAVAPSDEPPPAPSVTEPGTLKRPDQSALDQRLATVAGAAGTRPEAVDATEVNRPKPPSAADADIADVKAFSSRGQEPVVPVEAKDIGAVAPPTDAPHDGGDRSTAAAPHQEPLALPPETPADQVSRRQPVEPAPAEPTSEQPVPAANEQAAGQEKSPSDQAVAGIDTDQGEPQVPAAPARQADNTTGAPRPEPPPVLEPVPPAQPEQYRSAPTTQPPAAEQPPLLQIDQIDVVVSDPAPAQPAAPARSRLAAISASRRYLRRL